MDIIYYIILYKYFFHCMDNVVAFPFSYTVVTGLGSDVNLLVTSYSPFVRVKTGHILDSRMRQ